MSRSRGNGREPIRKNTKPEFGGDFRGFADVYLTDTAIEAVNAQLSSGDWDVVNFLAHLLADGYKFSIAWNARGRSVIATAIGKAEDNPNYGLALSAFAPSVEQALLVLWAKMEIVCKGGAWTSDNPENDGQLPLWR
jgi:hypothetical protein